MKRFQIHKDFPALFLFGLIPLSLIFSPAFPRLLELRQMLWVAWSVLGLVLWFNAQKPRSLQNFWAFMGLFMLISLVAWLYPVPHQVYWTWTALLLGGALWSLWPRPSIKVYILASSGALLSHLLLLSLIRGKIFSVFLTQTYPHEPLWLGLDAAIFAAFVIITHLFWSSSISQRVWKILVSLNLLGAVLILSFWGDVWLGLWITLAVLMPLGLSQNFSKALQLKTLGLLMALWMIGLIFHGWLGLNPNAYEVQEQEWIAPGLKKATAPPDLIKDQVDALDLRWNTRFFLWSTAWNGIADRNGMGNPSGSTSQWIDRYGDVHSNYYQKRLNAFPNFEEVHQEFLQFWLDWGIVLFGLSLAFIFFLGRDKYRTDAAPIGLLGILLALFFPLHFLPSAMMFWTAAVFAVPPEAMEQKSPFSWKLKTIFALSAIFLMSIWVRDLWVDYEIQWGNLYFLEHDARNSAAREHYQKALELRPDDIHALAMMAALEIQDGEGEQAWTRIQELLTRAPHHSSFVFEAVQALKMIHEEQKALDLLKQLIEAQPHLIQAYLDRAELYRNTGLFLDALQVLNAALDMDLPPVTQGEIHLLAAELLIHMDRLDEAQMHIDRAEQIHHYRIEINAARTRRQWERRKALLKKKEKQKGKP